LSKAIRVALVQQNADQHGERGQSSGDEELQVGHGVVFALSFGWLNLTLGTTAISRQS
jgi:hypothetical protein